MTRINEQNEFVWQRRLGGGGFFNGDVVLASMKQNGLIKALQNVTGSQEFKLLHLQDSYAQFDCLPDIPKDEVVTEVPIIKTELTTSVTALALMFFPEPYDIIDAPLEMASFCLKVDLCPEICANELDDDEDGYVDCFDTDCDCFDADTSCLVDPPVNNFSAKLDWESTIDDVSVAAVPIVANLNPHLDSIPEILVFPSSATSNTLGVASLLMFKCDGANASNPHALAIPVGNHSCRQGHVMVE